MIRDVLPDFEECLKYSILGKRSFVTFVRKDSVEEATKSISPELLVQRAVSNLLHGLRFQCVILNEISANSIIFDDEKDGDIKYDIRVIPNVNSLSKDEQTILAKQMTIDETKAEETFPIQIFIGIVPWSVNTSETDGKIHTTVLKSSIQVCDWLKHKFWIAGLTPEEHLSDDNNDSKGATDTIEEGLEGITESINIKNDFSEVHMEPAVRRYILDIMVHLRLHRLTYSGKGGGIIKDALDSMILLCKILSFERGKMFVTPNIVKEVSFIYFPMHLVLITTSARDTSILYGSKSKLVEEFLDNIAKVKLQNVKDSNNALFLEYLVVNDVLSKIVPTI